MLNSGTLTSKELVKAELYRIALTNAEGPAIQAIRDINPNAMQEADGKRQAAQERSQVGALAGIPVLVNDSIDVDGHADERRLDRAPGKRCRRRTRRSSPS